MADSIAETEVMSQLAVEATVTHFMNSPVTPAVVLTIGLSVMATVIVEMEVMKLFVQFAQLHSSSVEICRVLIVGDYVMDILIVKMGVMSESRLGAVWVQTFSVAVMAIALVP